MRIYSYCVISVVMYFILLYLNGLIDTHFYNNPFYEIAYATDNLQSSINGQQPFQNYGNNNINNTDIKKYVILTFGDIPQSQFTEAKPILDRFGFKANFFVTCNWVGEKVSDAQRMTWSELQQLYREGHDVESKTMDHKDLNHLSLSDLEYEIADSKKCLQNHDISNVTIFAPPHGNAWKNATVIDMISKYYDYADNGLDESFFLHCDGENKRSPTQKDCSTYDENNSLNAFNRYSIREFSHNALDKKYDHDDSQILPHFIDEVNLQSKFNTKEKLRMIPVIAYHRIDDTSSKSSTGIPLFESEMKYLHDNGFNIIRMSDVGYDNQTNVFYIKG